MKKIAAIIGARPQFIKHAPVEMALNQYFNLISIHTGQHYDHNMSGVFFDELNLQQPNYQLSICGLNHGVQTGKMMQEIEPIIESENPDAILVYGDTNSTLAGALVGSKLDIPIVHIEAGLRSYNRQMPEEINRVLTDHISSLLFAPTKQAVLNLNKEGIDKNVILCGDVMCDMVEIMKAKNLINDNQNKNSYYYATIHRPYNTDNPKQLLKILETFNNLKYKVKIALHPRTQSKLKSYNLNIDNFKNIELYPPLSYLENLNMQYNSRAIITDSGGMQKEAYMLKKKCVTLRSETEWIETVQSGWNILLFEDLSKLQIELEIFPSYYYDNLYGGGNSAAKIATVMYKFFT